jgi:hypothetical protein
MRLGIEVISFGSSVKSLFEQFWTEIEIGLDGLTFGAKENSYEDQTLRISRIEYVSS